MNFAMFRQISEKKNFKYQIS